jgi:hypothetical protein
MEQPSLGSPDRIYQEDSEIRVVLQELIEAHGISAVKQVLRSIESANPVENTRSRGRPAGPAIDDWPALQDAAAIWRQRGGGPVWPALTAVAKSLRGQPESNARRLFSRILERGRGEDFERAGIGDFRSAAFERLILRAVYRAGPRYFFAVLKMIVHLEPSLQHITFPPLTLEDIVILIQPSPLSKIFPLHLINRDSYYVLYNGELKLPQPKPRPIALENAITFDDITIMDYHRSTDVKLSQDLASARPVLFDLIPYPPENLLIPRQPIALDRYRF